MLETARQVLVLVAAVSNSLSFRERAVCAEILTGALTDVTVVTSIALGFRRCTLSGFLHDSPITNIRLHDRFRCAI